MIRTAPPTAGSERIDSCEQGCTHLSIKGGSCWEQRYLVPSTILAPQVKEWSHPMSDAGDATRPLVLGGGTTALMSLTENS